MTHISGLISECEVGVFLGGSSGSGRFDRLDNKAVQFLECAPLPSPQRLRTYNNTTWFFQLCIDIQLNDTATHEHSGDLLASSRQVLVSLLFIGISKSVSLLNWIPKKPCKSTSLDLSHRPWPRCFTTLIYYPVLPPCFTNLIYHPNSRSWFTTMVYHPDLPPWFHEVHGYPWNPCGFRGFHGFHGHRISFDSIHP